MKGDESNFVAGKGRGFDFYTYTPFMTDIHHRPIVGEPKSRIVQKHTFFALERYTVGILHTDSLNCA